MMKLGLKVSDDSNNAPSLSKLYLSSSVPGGVEKLTNGLAEICTHEDGSDFIRDQNDSFVLERTNSFSLEGFREAVPANATDKPSERSSCSLELSNKATPKVDEQGAAITTQNQIVDFATVVKPIVVYDSGCPDSKETPYFNHAAYFSNLSHYYKTSPRETNTELGQRLLYGEVVTSTQTLLEKNPKLLRNLPHGFTFAATVQVAGRGRGNNVWVSPAGSLIFSTVIRHEVSLQQQAPIVFIQYLAAMAVVEAVRTYDKGYQNVEIRLKWPNDVYALDPNAPPNASFQNKFTKIGGILVNSHYSSAAYDSVLGIGLNVSNAMPTTSLNSLLSSRFPRLEPFVAEKLLARVISSFSALYTRFRRTGWDDYLEDKYYAMWLHTGQIVDLEMEAGKRARICGITRDWGLLVAEEVDEEGRGYGRKIELQSDSNSFDFFKGLVKRKM